MNERATPETDSLEARIESEGKRDVPLRVYQKMRRLERQRDELVDALIDLRTFHRVLFKHPSTAKNGIEHRQCRFCDSMWELGQAETHNGACISNAARTLLANVKGGK